MPNATTDTPVRAETKIVAHSTFERSPDLITVQATGRRFILSELNTHRTLSKNSASSRAIPFPKQVRKIIDDLAYPEVWGAEKKGMQAGDEIDDVEEARVLWEQASQEAVAVAEDLAALGVHKSIVNRLLEPFMWHTVVMTGTAWQNFFDQRCSPLAQAEIRVMAEGIETAIETSVAQHLEIGEWHLPYADPVEAMSTYDYETLTKISAGRCARVSYLTQEGIRDPQADIDLYESLVGANPPHWSPLEHVATPWPDNCQEWDSQMDFVGFNGTLISPDTSHLPRIGNLLGWRSLRTTVEYSKGLVTYR